ncbi:30S ribosomal protein S15 [Deinococcus cellulosilyticus]|uniref:Small ribosomal subunit protein uS15 n=1 Tax=Deinococcus cellulosilyticus (strain DSM 18568 / NBRC 106333 / KACC 11606 / 5516J-15) TaxID=1223518 RepID=A0A511N5Y7_DEIC1|nr:30S ribosomal protein S15 [Deinococcus cellulosilyticus]GEM47821.1 30S ribosomal protein S15 [Deinococcus cellulosilyticus NBRC 106333 = KACC 11606]
MSINKTEVIQQYATKEGDTGSTAVQIAILTARINNLSAHLNVNQKDKHGQRGLQMMVGQRRRLLRYLERSDFQGYIELTDKLGIRRGHAQVK